MSNHLCPATSNRGGGVFLCLVAAGLLLKPPDWLHYHAPRFWGLNSRASPRVIEREIEHAAKAYKLSPQLLKALVKVESAYQVRAESRVGARGLSQVMPENSKRCGLNPDQLWDPVSNLRCGARILRQEIDRLGNVTDALTVYNCGRRDCKAGKQYAQKVLEISKNY